jgi:hypothetical protein
VEYQGLSGMNRFDHAKACIYCSWRCLVCSYSMLLRMLFYAKSFLSGGNGQMGMGYMSCCWKVA